MRFFYNRVSFIPRLTFSAYCICSFPFMTEPSAPPDNVRKFNTSSTSIVVQWDQVPPADQNGVILSYTVTYKALPDGSEKTRNITAPTTVATLTGLNEYTNYSITVFASTIKGGGNKSVFIVVNTDGDSKFSQNFLFLLYTINGHNSTEASAYILL